MTGRFVVLSVRLLLVIILMAFPGASAEAARIGLFLGTFDPPHQGVARMAVEARHRLHLDEIYMVPVPEPVDRAEVTPVVHRLAMIRLLARDLPWLKTLNEADLKVITSRRPQNLFEALREDIAGRLGPNDEIVQIVGEDALPKLVARRQLPVVGERRVVVVFPRQGVAETKSPAIEKALKDGRLVRLPVEVPDVASRDLRAMFVVGIEPDEEMIAPVIRSYIRREGLYGLPTASLSRVAVSELRLPGYLSIPVLLHSPTTETSFVPAHLESMLSEMVTQSSDSDIPESLAAFMETWPLQVTLFQAPTTDALDWLETQGWRTLYGFVPEPLDERPMFFFGRRGLQWHLFITGVYAPARFSHLAAEMRQLLGRAQIPLERLSVLVAANLVSVQ